MFTDNVKLFLQAGSGGSGIISWRREKFTPKGGPYGGDGGDGGNIIFKANPQLLSLENFCFQKKFKAENGRAGESNNCTGRNGQDLILQAPLGTVIKDAKTQEIICELLNEEEPFTLCRGGKGGKGNSHFKSSTNQAPYFCTSGQKGEIFEVELELKTVADAGLVGFPNAGKSTLLSKITHSKTKIANYPFTTLFPNLGQMECADYSRLLVADIPGIIKDAHLNKGLGISFLRHIERCSLLIFIIDIAGQDGRDPIEDFETLREEIKNYSKELTKKPFLIVLNKMDAENAKENAKLFLKKFRLAKEQVFQISALEKRGLEPLKKAIQGTIKIDSSLQS